jgi:hypothetical protein
MTDARKQYIKTWRSNNPERILKYNESAKAKKYVRKKTVREWEKENPDKHKNQILKRNYGITVDQYNKMISDQDNKCLICKINMLNPCVDHCHKTGMVRGILCRKCNQAIGFLNDSPANCESAAKYLLCHL